MSKPEFSDLRTFPIIRRIVLVTSGVIFITFAAGIRIDIPSFIDLFVFKISISRPHILFLLLLLSIYTILVFYFRRWLKLEVSAGHWTTSPPPSTQRIRQYEVVFPDGMSWNEKVAIATKCFGEIDAGPPPPNPDSPQLNWTNLEFTQSSRHFYSRQVVNLIPLSSLIPLILMSPLSFDSSVKQQSLFASNQDELWEEAIKTSPCPHIENVPIVGSGSIVTSKNAALSSIVGYINADFPILGPPPPSRLLRLVAQTEAKVSEVKPQRDSQSGRGGKNKQLQSLLYKRLHEVENQAFREFLHYSRGRSYEAEGLIRAYALQESYNHKPRATLQRLAFNRAQVSRVRTIPPSRQAIAQIIRSKSIAILSVDDDLSVYPVLGGLRDGEYITVINTREARYIEKSAAEVLLTPQDLHSEREFAKKAREQLRGKILKMEILVTCTGSRPPGVTFIRTDAVPTTAELSVIDGWELDVSRLLIDEPNGDPND